VLGESASIYFTKHDENLFTIVTYPQVNQLILRKDSV